MDSKSDTIYSDVSLLSYTNMSETSQFQLILEYDDFYLKLLNEEIPNGR